MIPLIGIGSDFHSGTGTNGGDPPVYVVQARYVTAIRQAGALPVILPYCDVKTLRVLLLQHLHGIMLIGSGSDIHPRWYGERPRGSFPIMSEARAEFDVALAREAWANNVPLLAICGGMQHVNVALGGSLIQDILTQQPSAKNHKPGIPASRVSHTISLSPGSRLANIVGTRQLRVNSSHHQALATVAPALHVSAVAPDGIIEAIEDPRRRFFLGIQWHPEHLSRRVESHRRLFAAFVHAARRYAMSSKKPKDVVR